MIGSIWRQTFRWVGLIRKACLERIVKESEEGVCPSEGRFLGIWSGESSVAPLHDDLESLFHLHHSVSSDRKRSKDPTGFRQATPSKDLKYSFAKLGREQAMKAEDGRDWTEEVPLGGPTGNPTIACLCVIQGLGSFFGIFSAKWP